MEEKPKSTLRDLKFLTILPSFIYRAIPQKAKDS